jgi:excisionase family DNA binding protein
MSGIRIEFDPAMVDAIAAAVAARVAELLARPIDGQGPMTIDEVAGVLRLKPRTVRAMIADGRLPRVPGTAKPLVPRAAVSTMCAG